MFKLLLLNFFLISVYSKNSRPTFTIYNNFSEENATYTYKFHADVPKFDATPFGKENRRCWVGVWLRYSGENYNGNICGDPPTNDMCSNVGDRVPYRSFRIIGDPANYSTPAVSFFTRINYDSHYPPALRFVDDLNLGGKYASFILNGDQPITLYSATNFTGMKLCVEPNQWNGIATTVKNVESLGLIPHMLKSFRFGCHIEKIIQNCSNGSTIEIQNMLNITGHK